MNIHKKGKNIMRHHHGFPPQVPSQLRSAYAQRGIKQLFPWQTECLADPALFSPEFSNLVYSAPTSAGKTLIAEVLVACNCMKTGRRALFVLPYISSAREKLFFLQSLWRPMNIVVKPFIGASSASVHGWSAAVCTIEKANALLNALIEADLAAEIGVVVIDELHMLFDSERGLIIENLIAKLLFISERNSRIQLIGMSATLGGDEPHQLLAKWIKARLFASNFRPLTLMEFLLHENGQLLGLDGQRRGQLSERFIIKGDNKCMIGICLEALIQAQSILVFCATKAEAEQSAILIAKYLKYCADKGDATRFPELCALLPCDKLAEAVDYFRQKTNCAELDLINCIGQGVAYHHAGLTTEEREEIEGMFRCGHLRVLVSTSTLSSGVNLPAHRVLIRANATSPIPLTFITYKQMIGRAGRQGQAQVLAGESYLLCSSKDWPIVQRQIQHRNFAHPRRSFSRLLLETINSCLCCTFEDVKELARRCTFSQQSRPLEEELAELAQLKLIAITAKKLNENEDDENEGDENEGEEENEQNYHFDPNAPEIDWTQLAVRPTQLGRAVLASSLDFRTASQVFDGLQNAMQSICLDSELHMLFLVTPTNNLAVNEKAIDWNFFHQQWSHLPEELRRVANRIGISEQFFMQKLAGRTFPQGHSALKIHVRFFASLVLFDLINEKPLQNVARHWKINRGLLQSLQQQAATYAYMIVSFCDRLGWIHLRTLLDGFAERLQFGIRRDLTELVRIEGIDAIRARAFHQQGISSLVALANCSLDKVSLILRKAVPFELSDDVEEDGTTRNTWLHGEPPMSEKRAAKTLLDRATAAVKEQIRAFQLPSLHFGPPTSPMGLDLSLRFDSSYLSIPDDEERQNQHTVAAADLSTSALEQAWLSEDESNESDRNVGVIFCSSAADLTDVDSLCDTLSPLRLNQGLRELQQNEGAEEKPIKCEKIAKNDNGKEHILPVIGDDFKENIPPGNETPMRNTNEKMTKSILKKSWANRMSAAENTTLESPSNAALFCSPRPKKKHCHISSIPPRGPPKEGEIIFFPNKTKEPMTSIVPICSCTTVQNLLLEFTECALTFVNEVVLIAYGRQHFFSFPLTAPTCSTCFDSTSLLFAVLAEPRIRKWVQCGLEFLRQLRPYLPASSFVSSPINRRQFEGKNLFCLRTFEAVQFGVDDGSGGNATKNGQQLRALIKKITSVDEQSIIQKQLKSIEATIHPSQNGHQLGTTALSAKTIQLIGQQIIAHRRNEDGAEKQHTEEQLWRIYMQSMEVIAEMESTGMHMDRRKAGKMVEHILEQMAEEEEKIFELAGEQFNLDSAAEVSKILFVKMQLAVPEHIVSRNSKRRHLPTSNSVLKQIGHPICQRVERWRKLENALSCLRGLLAAVSSKDNRIRTNFENAGTSSGRIPCHSPNLQYIPKRALLGKYSVRSMLSAPPGRRLVAADYSQLELRVLCALSGDRKLAKMLVASSTDPFELMAQQFSADIDENDGNMAKNAADTKVTREKAKQLCYAIIYGMGPENLGKELRMAGGTEEARELIDRFFQLFPRVKCWLAIVIERCKKRGHVRTHFGRRRKFKWAAGVEEGQQQQKSSTVVAIQRAMERRCVNFIIQGTASELFRIALVKVNEQLKKHQPSSLLVMQLHDELIVEVDEHLAEQCAAIVKECMESVSLDQAPAADVCFPVKLSMGKDWGTFSTFQLLPPPSEQK